MRWLGYGHQQPFRCRIRRKTHHNWQGQTILTLFVEGGRLAETPPVLSQARRKVNGKTVPDPANLESDASTNGWRSELVTDTAAVFHKAMIWKDGILSISGGIPKSEQQAYLKHWTKTANGWSAQTLCR